MLRIYCALIAVLISVSCATQQPFFSVYNAKPMYDASAPHFDKINPNAPKAGSLHFSLINTFDHLNPFIILGNAPVFLSTFCFARLLQESSYEVGVSYPYVAKSIKISADNKIITFYLNEYATFSDGTPITADDVVWSYEYIVKTNPARKQYYRDVTSVKALDSHTIEFKNQNPNNKELPGILGQLEILSKAYFEKNMPESGAIIKPFPVSGPYIVATADFGRSIVFKRVQNWWGEKIPSNVGLYNFDTVKIDFYRERNAAFQAFLSGNANIWVEESAQQWNTAYSNNNVVEGKIKKAIVVGDKIAWTRGYAFNLRKEKFQDIRVRKAINLAFNFESLNQAIFYKEYTRLNSYYGTAELAHQNVPKGLELALLEPYKNQLPPEVFSHAFKNPVYTDNLVPREMIQKALDLLKEAGWTLKNQVLVNKKGEPFEITIPYPTPSQEKIVLHIKRNLERIGINVIPRQLDITTFTETSTDFNFDMIAIAIPQSHTLGNEQRDYFGSKSANIKGSKNFAGIQNPVVDILIEKLVNANDYQSMLATAHAIDRILCWNYYILPGWTFEGLRIAYWNQFDMPQEYPTHMAFPILSWWAKPQAVKPSPTTVKQSSVWAKIKSWLN